MFSWFIYCCPSNLRFLSAFSVGRLDGVVTILGNFLCSFMRTGRLPPGCQYSTGETLHLWAQLTRPPKQMNGRKSPGTTTDTKKGFFLSFSSVFTGCKEPVSDYLFEVEL